jgi:hypothetical protein
MSKSSSNIKSVKPTSNSNYKQGYFNPKNPNKYKGNPPIIYRSGWELSFMNLLDTSPNILEWTSEPVGIEYLNPLDNKVHTYYVDFYFKVKTENSMRSVIAEVKPKKQIQFPKQSNKKGKGLKSLANYKREAETYIINQSKFEAASVWAMKNGMEFVVITEDFLYEK